MKWIPASEGLASAAVADLRPRAVDEVDDAVGEARRLPEPHQVVGREHRRRGRLPEDDVAHQRRRGGQVAGDRREVERRDGEDEPLERPVLDAVPDAGPRERLLGVDARHELDVEAEEVDQLAGGVDLRLVGGLRLPEHRRGVEGVAPGAGEQLGGAQEDGGALLPRPARPVLPGRGGSLDRGGDLLGTALLDVGEHVLARVRHQRRTRPAGRDVLAADHERRLDPLACHLRQARRQRRPLGAPGRELAHRLVAGRRHAEDRVGARAQLRTR